MMDVIDRPCALRGKTTHPRIYDDRQSEVHGARQRSLCFYSACPSRPYQNPPRLVSSRLVSP